MLPRHEIYDFVKKQFAMKKVKYGFLLILILIAIGIGIKTLIPKKDLPNVQDSFSYSISQISFSKWNTPTGIPYNQVPGANLGATSFQILDKNRIVFLCNSTGEIIIINNLTGESIQKFQVSFAPRDFVYENGIFYVLSEYEVTLYDEIGNEVKKYPFPTIYNGIKRLIRYNGSTYLLLPSGNSLMIETLGDVIKPREYQGIITSTGQFARTQITGNYSYSIIISTSKNKTFENSFTTDKKVAGIFIVGSTKNRVVIDVQTFISENPITIERIITSINLNNNGLGAIISSIKVPDCYYVISNKDFYVSEKGEIYNMMTSPQGIFVFSLTETKTEKAKGYPSSLVDSNFHTNDHLIKLD